MATVVSIGRGLPEGEYPENFLSTETWARFQQELVSLCQQRGLDIYFSGHGVGHSDRWGLEDAFTLVLSDIQYDDWRQDFDRELSELGSRYGQEAVAVTEGPTRFV